MPQRIVTSPMIAKSTKHDELKSLVSEVLAVLEAGGPVKCCGWVRNLSLVATQADAYSNRNASIGSRAAALRAG